MAKKGLLVEYSWCTGCHSCEVACQMENGLPVGQFGIKVNQVGPWQYGEDSWQYEFVPFLTDQCTLCSSRVAKGKEPSCVKHCQSRCIRIVDVDEAAAAATEKRKIIFQAI